MPTALEYMKFSLNVYDASVTNLIGVPSGWSGSLQPAWILAFRMSIFI